MSKRLIQNFIALVVGIAIGATATFAFSAHTSRHAANEAVHKMHSARGTCSAVMIAPERAMTAKHCIDMESPQLNVSGRDYVITEAYANSVLDLAVLIVPGAPCPCSTIREEPAREGELAMVVGYPYGIARVTTYGEVQGRFTNPEDKQEYVLVTAPTAPGNSGGGVFDMQGYLMGIMVANDGAYLSLYIETLTVPLKDKREF